MLAVTMSLESRILLVFHSHNRSNNEEPLRSMSLCLIVSLTHNRRSNYRLHQEHNLNFHYVHVRRTIRLQSILYSYTVVYISMLVASTYKKCTSVYIWSILEFTTTWREAARTSVFKRPNFCHYSSECKSS